MKQTILEISKMNREKENELAAVEVDQISVEEWLVIRRKAALEIDPKTAEYTWVYGQTLDPYGVYDLLPEEQQIQRNHFARSPGSEIWISFGDLPPTVLEALRERMKRESPRDDVWATFFEATRRT